MTEMVIKAKMAIIAIMAMMSKMVIMAILAISFDNFCEKQDILMAISTLRLYMNNKVFGSGTSWEPYKALYFFVFHKYI